MKAVPRKEESSETDEEDKVPTTQEGTSSTASASPKNGAALPGISGEKEKETTQADKAETRSATLTPASRRSRKSALEKGIFEEELRGYRLLNSAVLSQTERQHVLTFTRAQGVRQARKAFHDDAVLGEVGVRRRRWHGGQEGYASEETRDAYDESWEYPYGEDEESYWHQAEETWDAWDEGELAYYKLRTSRGRPQ